MHQWRATMELPLSPARYRHWSRYHMYCRLRVALRHICHDHQSQVENGRRSAYLSLKRVPVSMPQSGRNEVTLLETMVLAVLQGLTEFVPISSSAHLVLVPWLFAWKPHELALDTTLHLGTLAAVLGYFGGDVVRLAKGWALTLWHPSKWGDPDSRLAWWIIVGTIPAAMIGYRFEHFFEELFTQPYWVGFFLLITAALLTSCEKMSLGRKELNAIGLMTALGIGFAQAAAIAPGISRSGATIAAAMLFGLKREASARYSFLLSIPIILGAGGLQLLKLYQHGVLFASPTPYLVGFMLAAITGYLCIHFLLLYLRKNSLYPFACYCALVGGIVLLSFLIRH